MLGEDWRVVLTRPLQTLYLRTSTLHNVGYSVNPARELQCRSLWEPRRVCWSVFSRHRHIAAVRGFLAAVADSIVGETCLGGVSARQYKMHCLWPLRNGSQHTNEAGRGKSGLRLPWMEGEEGASDGWMEPVLFQDVLDSLQSHCGQPSCRLPWRSGTAALLLHPRPRRMTTCSSKVFQVCTPPPLLPRSALVLPRA